MAFSTAHVDLDADETTPGLSTELGLKNLGLSVYMLRRGEGFDFFHNHREQEEIYLCIEGSADLMFGGDVPQRLTLHRGDVARVDPPTLRAIGNLSSERAVLVIAGACGHTYPAGFGYHDVIADVLSMQGHGTTGFHWPPYLRRSNPPRDVEDEC